MVLASKQAALPASVLWPCISGMKYGNHRQQSSNMHGTTVTMALSQAHIFGKIHQNAFSENQVAT